MIRYSGLFQAFDYSISALAKVDAQKALAIISSLPEQVRQDMIERDQYWAKYEGTISKVSRNVNDAYLKANNQTDGVSSYHKMVNLLLAEQRYKWVNDYDPSPDIL